MRGKLPWPVQGARDGALSGTTEPFGRRHGWKGEMIEAARGAKLRAPYFGRVVYAMLQGLGLLLIIGHSGGYMTLYGHAEVLISRSATRWFPGERDCALSDTAPHRSCILNSQRP